MSNSLRLIDSTLHDLTAPQILEQMIHFFKLDRSQPVVLYTPRGMGKSFVQRIRTELSRARKAKFGNKPAEFGFVVTSEVPIYLGGKRLDSIALEWRMTPLQQFRMFANKPEFELGFE